MLKKLERVLMMLHAVIMNIKIKLIIGNQTVKKVILFLPTVNILLIFQSNVNIC
mgnify:CR=1 FL=1